MEQWAPCHHPCSIRVEILAQRYSTRSLLGLTIKTYLLAHKLNSHQAQWALFLGMFFTLTYQLTSRTSNRQHTIFLRDWCGQVVDWTSGPEGPARTTCVSIPPPVRSPVLQWEHPSKVVFHTIWWIPPSGNNTVLLSIVSSFSKAAHFISLVKLPSALETVSLCNLFSVCKVSQQVWLFSQDLPFK